MSREAGSATRGARGRLGQIPRELPSGGVRRPAPRPPRPPPPFSVAMETRILGGRALPEAEEAYQRRPEPARGPPARVPPAQPSRPRRVTARGRRGAAARPPPRNPSEASAGGPGPCPCPCPEPAGGRGCIGAERPSLASVALRRPPSPRAREGACPDAGLGVRRAASASPGPGNVRPGGSRRIRASW